MSEDKYELPEGWVEADFEQCIDIPEGPFIKIPQKQYLPQGKFSIIDQGSEFIAGYTNNEKEIFNGELPVIIFGDHTRIFKFIDFNFAIGADGTKILRTKKGIEPKYLFYYLKSIELPSRGYSRHYRYLRENKILLAPPSEQKRIVAKIEQLLANLEKTKQSLSKIPSVLKKFRQSVLAKAFNGELTEDWRAKQKDLEPVSKLLDHIHEERKRKLGKKYKEPEPIDTSDLPDLPEGWEWVELEMVADIIMGQSPPSTTYNKTKKGLPFFQGKAEFGELYPVPVKWCNAPKKVAEAGDVLISVRAPVGPTNLTNQKCCIGRGLGAIRTLVGIPPKLILYYLRNIEQSLSKEGQGSTFTAISRDNLANIAFPLPPLKEQNYIVQKIEDFFTQADTIGKSVKIAQAHCEKLTQSILAKVFRGELVEQDPNDEPAEALLEKIKMKKP